MIYEVQIKFGSRWSNQGTVAADSMRGAALHISYISGRKVIRVRPEGSRDKWYSYRLKAVPRTSKGNE